ncbi:MAG: YbhB/YbcL family Raf kinase inhibitor-like protein [Chloroflexi bacterium]|nr:YbhB/YbcL family Raf kinase inhibitor-like protein [Chloroflexota bacterium]
MFLMSMLILMTLIAIACGGDSSEREPFDPQSSALATIEISSPAFGSGDSIPVEFTCDGDDLSPPLRWSKPPAGTRALVVVVDDPDAPGRIFRHWSVYNIPSGTRSLKESRPTTSRLENTTLQGKNDFGGVGYGGPCPPRGQEHEYVFFIYALSEPLDLEAEASPAEVAAAIRGRVLGAGSFSGMYVRR